MISFLEYFGCSSIAVCVLSKRPRKIMFQFLLLFFGINLISFFSLNKKHTHFKKPVCDSHRISHINNIFLFLNFISLWLRTSPVALNYENIYKFLSLSRLSRRTRWLLFFFFVILSFMSKQIFHGSEWASGTNKYLIYTLWYIPLTHFFQYIFFVIKSFNIFS